MQYKKLMRSLAGGSGVHSHSGRRSRSRSATTKSYEVTKRASGDEWCSAEELKAARAAYLEKQRQHAPAPRVKLRYAVALVKSSKRDEKLRGIALLDDLLASSFEPKECLYWFALHQCIKDVTANGNHAVDAALTLGYT